MQILPIFLVTNKFFSQCTQFLTVSQDFWSKKHKTAALSHPQLLEGQERLLPDSFLDDGHCCSDSSWGGGPHVSVGDVLSLPDVIHPELPDCLTCHSRLRPDELHSSSWSEAVRGQSLMSPGPGLTTHCRQWPGSGDMTLDTPVTIYTALPRARDTGFHLLHNPSRVRAEVSRLISIFHKPRADAASKFRMLIVHV